MSHDPRTLPIETLLADAGWVRALARRLVRDPSAADDLAQDALVAAWRHPPRAETNARSWLARVLRNLVRQRQRSESARGRREQGRARPGAHDDDVLERAELAQRLAQHVLALEEPYRTIVLQRFFDGRSAEEIAERMRVPSSTVRTRLERALARLRETLERENGREWLAALMPLAHGASAGSTIAGITGGIAMGTGTKIALALCAAALAGWMFWPTPVPSSPLPAQEQDSAPAARVALVQAPTDESSTQRQAEAPTSSVRPVPVPAKVAPAAAPELAPPGTIVGRVLRRLRGEEKPIGKVRVLLWPQSDDLSQRFSDKDQPQASTLSSADGTFRFAGLRGGQYVLRAVDERGLGRQTHALVDEQRAERPVELVFGAATIRARLHDESGQPLAASAWKLLGRTSESDGLEFERSSSDMGLLVFDELPAGTFLLAPADPLGAPWPGRTWGIELAEGDEVQIEAGEPGRAPAHWRGVVRSASGAPVSSGGTLACESLRRTRGGSEVRERREVLFDASARFDFALETGAWSPQVSLASRPDTWLGLASVAITGQDLEHDLVLEGARVSGTVQDSVTLRALEGYAGVLQVSVRRAGTRHPGALRTVQIDAQAHFAIDMLEEGVWEIVTFPLDVAATGKKLAFTIAPGQTEVALDVPVQPR